MHKILIIVACVPITPIAVGLLTLYRRFIKPRRHQEILVAPAIPAVE